MLAFCGLSHLDAASKFAFAKAIQAPVIRRRTSRGGHTAKLIPDQQIGEVPIQGKERVIAAA
jgi:hypothetical protein